MIENIKDFRAELHVETLGHFKVLKQSGIEIPEIWPLRKIAPAALLSSKWDAEECLSPHLIAVEVRVLCIGYQTAWLVEQGTFDFGIGQEIPSLVHGTYNEGGTHVRIVGSLITTKNGVRLAT